MTQCQLLINMGFTAAEIKSSVDSYIGSKQYIREIVPLSICNIVYNRLEHHEDNFESRELETLKFKIFKPKMKNNKFVNLYKGSKGAMHALDNNYLKELFLFFKDKKTGEILENYKFTFCYTKAEEIAEKPKSAYVIAKTDLLLKSIESLKDYKKLFAENVKFNIELTYYEDVTPKEYEPPYYEAEKGNPNIEYLSQTNSLNYINLGRIRTGYHVLRCGGRGKALQSSSSIARSMTSCIESPNESNNQKELSETGSNLTLSEIEDINDCMIQNSDSDICCPCEIKCSFEKSGTIATILCSSCYRIQHSACMGYQNIKKMPADYICHVCGDLEGKNATDKILKNTLMKHRRKLAIIRLAIAYSINTNEVPTFVIEKITPEIQQTVWSRLQRMKVVVNTNTGKQLDLKALQESQNMFYDFQSRNADINEKQSEEYDSMLLPKDIPKKRHFEEMIPSNFDSSKPLIYSSDSTLTVDTTRLNEEILIKKLKKNKNL